MERDVSANIPSRSDRCRFDGLIRVGLGWASTEQWRFDGTIDENLKDVRMNSFIENGEGVTWRRVATFIWIFIWKNFFVRLSEV